MLLTYDTFAKLLQVLIHYLYNLIFKIMTNLIQVSPLQKYYQFDNYYNFLLVVVQTIVERNKFIYQLMQF
jgi:hypothetical protein